MTEETPKKKKSIAKTILIIWLLLNAFAFTSALIGCEQNIATEDYSIWVEPSAELRFKDARNSIIAAVMGIIVYYLVKCSKDEEST